MLRLAIAVLFIFGLESSRAYACPTLQTPDEHDRHLRALINDADHVFYGRVEWVTRRRWGPDDELSLFAQRRLGEEKEVPPDQPNLRDFSEAIAQVFVHTSLKNSGIADRFTKGGIIVRSVPIDLLRPFGGTSCHDYPRTCPWDVKSGDFLAVAVVEQFSGPLIAVYCERVERRGLSEMKGMRDRRATTPADEMLWPFVETARALRDAD